MSGRWQIEGYNNLIQSSEISSSSDPINSRPLRITQFTPLARRSYRTRALLPNHNMCVNISREIPTNTDPPVTCACGCFISLSKLSTRVALISVAIIFLTSLLALSVVYKSFPNLNEDESRHIKIPWNIEEAKNLGIVLDRYKHDHYFSVLTGVFLTYIFLQTFAIPGSLFLSILSGFLFNFYFALILVCTCSALGASLCFLLSQLLGRRLIWMYFPEKAKEWAVIVNKHNDNLFNYIVFLRVTPFFPNWFINLTAPVIGVPVVPFATGTFVGVAPPSFVAIQAGQTLHSMSASDSTFSWTSIFWLGVFAVVSLIPILLKKRLKEKFQ